MIGPCVRISFVQELERIVFKIEGAARVQRRPFGGKRNLRRSYWTELATCENTVLALEPISRIVPTTITRITASITAYSAIS
jgi:hypothetical protein